MILLCEQVKSVDVAYDLKCEDAPSHYGHGYGKDQSKVINLVFKTIDVHDKHTKKTIQGAVKVPTLTSSHEHLHHNHNSHRLLHISFCQGVLQQTKTLPRHIKHYVGDPGQ